MWETAYLRISALGIRFMRITGSRAFISAHHPKPVLSAYSTRLRTLRPVVAVSPEETDEISFTSRVLHVPEKSVGCDDLHAIRLC